MRYARRAWTPCQTTDTYFTRAELVAEDNEPRREGVGGTSRLLATAHLRLLLIAVQLVVFIAVQSLGERKAIGYPGDQCQLYHRPGRGRSGCLRAPAALCQAYSREEAQFLPMHLAMHCLTAYESNRV